MISKVRTDIQVLRGIAVLFVLLYHAKVTGWASGYLGVDIFFVISGYLITKLIVDGIERGDFSFRAFYFRRAKRLLPAAYATFLVTSIAAPFLLTSGQMSDFKTQLIGAIGFVANIVLNSQTDYFSGSADLKPLLHIWSLSLEEQYYFVLPALLAFIPKRFWRTGSVLLVVGSLALCLFLVTRKPALAFFILPTRAWELGLGSIGALAVCGPRLAAVARIAFIPALAALVAVPVLPSFGPHPGPGALVVCVATLLVILRAHENLFENVVGRAVAKVGDWSYSLYLAHWPIFAFLNNAWIGDGEKEPSIEYRLAALALSFVLGYMLHRFVEVPCRQANWRLNAGTVLRGALASLGLVAVSSAVAMAVAPSADYVHRFRANHGFSPVCAGAAGVARPECRNSDAPDITVWGDSFAMHLVPGIAEQAKVLQATRSMCGPFVGLAVIDKQRPRAWAADCIVFNDSVLEYLKTVPSVRVVVLSSRFDYLLTTSNGALERDTSGATSTGQKEVVASQEVLLRGLRRTVDAVRATGRRVVVVAPPPTGTFDSARCLERKETNLLALGVKNECQISVSTWRRERVLVDSMLAAMPSDIPVIHLSDVLCDLQTCRSEDGVPIYRDGAHLSHEGSVLVAKRMQLAERINALAR